MTQNRRIGGSGYLLILLLSAFVVIGFRALRHQTTNPTTTAGSTVVPRAHSAARTPLIDPQFLAAYQGQLTSFLDGRPGRYGVTVYDLNLGIGIGINQDEIFRAASVNKLALAISLYKHAAGNQLDLDATTVIGADDVQNYGTGTIQLRGPDQSYSYRELARMMLQESDNTASYVLGRRLGLDNVQADLQDWGLTNTSISDNLTTPADVTLLMARLQRRELLPEAATSEIVDILQHTAWTDRLQSGVPMGLPVAHKIGTDIGIYNDAALFLEPAHAYVVVVLSGGTEEGDALASMTWMSQLAYQLEAGLSAASRRSR